MAGSEAGTPSQADAEDSAHGARAPGGHAKSSFWVLLIGSIGVVYGDIGTSPLYALRESLKHVTGESGVLQRADVLGIVSLIFWALLIIVTLKYVLLLLRLDNKGEGGTVALMALAEKALGRRTPFIFILGIVGASLFYGDALITPAISVLSAVEGLKAVPGLGEWSETIVRDGASVTIEHAAPIAPFIVPISIGILITLFAWQSRGTGRMGALFGPITLVWFLTLGALGVWHITEDPTILAALSPHWGVQFLATHVGLGFIVLGAVFLAVTGAEALYADMGHFGRGPVRTAWLFIVLPCLTLNYLGQGAFVLRHPEALENLFFETAPGVMRLPLVILATMATIIASQAVITGAYSMTQQAIQLGFLPRMEIRRTSETQAGQIYMPQVNWLLLAGVLVLTLAFNSSERLAAAYGIAVTGEMMVTSMLAFVAIWKLWKAPPWLAVAVCLPFFLIENVFLASNLTKVWSGGFVPILLGVGLCLVMWTWTRGTRLLSDTVRRDEPLGKLFETLSLHPPHRVRGTAIFLTGDPEVAPAALMHNLKHNQVLHEQIIILTVRTLGAPRAPESERVRIEDFLPDVKRVIVSFGFMETPNVVKALTAARAMGLKFDIMKTSFFLSRRTIVPSEKSGMPLWQDHLFIYLARNATNATDFFHIPSGRAVELGTQVMV
ncbi:MAG: potassium transporter Kup [Alphaproteobacteria bacterium]|nr:potassium transporter Kup [Alphaproteobacteria bacterium]